MIAKARAAITVGVAVGIVWALVAAPRMALACAVCSAGRDDESNAAFLISTIFMSVLPLAALGTFVFVLWRRFQKLEQTAATSIATSDRVASPVASPASPVN